MDASVAAPPAKAYTLRALFLAALAPGRSVLTNPLYGDDQRYAMGALTGFGASFTQEADRVVVDGAGGGLLAPEKVFIGNSGVSMRFLCSVAALAGKGGEKIVVDGDERMRQRPAGELLDALEALGAGVSTARGDGCPPIEIIGKSLRGGKAVVDAEKSSQFVSSLLVALPLAPEDSVLSIKGAFNSRPYVGITLDCMKEFGVRAADEGNRFTVKGQQSYTAREYAIEGDYSSASFFFEAAAITGGRVRVSNLKEDSLQGDKRFLELMRGMGCKVDWSNGTVLVEGPDRLEPVDADMADCPDIVMPLAVACAFADGESRIANVGTLKYKESDRLEAVRSELARMGVNAQVIDGEELVVKGVNPENLHGAAIETYNDHRIAMSFAVAGLRVPGVRIRNPGCVSKSFPDFFERLEALR
ncbi:3-phosphoshikimate 1-carboxyvinyltransferase [Candidatus Micrarchaeota archaeon CG1_02_55_22]|nr:MAG: 3-phosphoshikimate 1-carboxyvinyltransferase [Candidatus Micrarchaeota archaeon CG1_02_55_22]